MPSITEWLGEEMKKDNFDKVGASPNFFGNGKTIRVTTVVRVLHTSCSKHR